MSRPAPKCRQCHRRPARAADEFCSDVCAHTWAHGIERTVPRETTGGEIVTHAWASSGQRLNLQNSA